jgi:integrase
VTKADLDGLLHDMAHKSGLQAEPNRVFTSMIGFWSWVVHQRGYRLDNPMAGMKRPIKVEPSQARQKAGTVAVLSLDELARLWRLAPSLPSFVLPDLVRCMLAVPLRREEWTALRWSEVREIVEDGWSGLALKLPAERMKGRRLAVVPLPRQVAALLNERKKITGKSDFVFSVPGSTSPFAGWKRAAETLRKKLGADTDWTPHDIRRSVATALARDVGADTEIIKRILQHSEESLLGVTAVYQRSRRLQQQADALEAWLTRLESAAAVNTNVVALEARHAG